MNFNNDEFLRKMYSENNPIIWLSGKLDRDDELLIEVFVSTSTFTKEYLSSALATAVKMTAEEKGLNVNELLDSIKEQVNEMEEK